LDVLYIPLIEPVGDVRARTLASVARGQNSSARPKSPADSIKPGCCRESRRDRGLHL